MAQVTLKDLSQSIDVAKITAHARQQWERQQVKRMSIEQWLIRLLPFGLVVMVLVFFLLSAPHTIDMLDMITPGFGWVAPVGFEVGILVISALIEAGWKTPLTRGLLLMLIIMAVMINTTGAFMVVVGGVTELGASTFVQLLARFPELPATTQAVLFLVVPVGVAVPVISKFAGEAVVKLALGKVELSQTSLDDLWTNVEQREVKSALMQAALEMGAGVKTAGKWASLVVEQIYTDDLIDAVSGQIIAPAPQKSSAYASIEGQQDSGTGQDSPRYGFNVSPQITHYEPQWTVIDKKDSPGQGTAGQSVLTRAMVKTWLRDNPGAWQDMSNHDISRAIIGSDSGYKTVQRTLRDLNMRR